jgi:hypothetical protein
MIWIGGIGAFVVEEGVLLDILNPRGEIWPTVKVWTPSHS